MPINFPSSPTSGSQYTYASKTWQWNGYAWDIVTPTTISTINGCTSSAITITGTANEVTVDTTCPNIVIGLPNNLVVQNLTVTGSLLVSGGITTQMSEVVLIEDNFVTLNANVTAGAPTENAGIIISRGASANVDLRWNETSDNWQFTNNGTDYWNLPINVVNTFNGSTGAVNFAVPVASATVTGAASFGNQFVVSAAGAVSLTSNYVSSVNGSTGAITITGAGAITYTQSGTTNTINARLASTSVTGVASFNATRFTVSATGAVDLASAFQVTGDTVVAGNAITATRSGNSVTIDNNGVRSFNGSTGAVNFAVPVASASVTGVASFSNTHFVVSGAGAVSLATPYTVTGDTTIAGTAITISRSGNAATINNNGVISVNGSTGAVTGIATTSTNTFTGLQTMNAGLTTNHLYVSNGATFANGLVVSSGTIAGTLSTAAQPNITSVGTLTSLTTSGLATFNAGVTASHLYVTNGATFASRIQGVGATFTGTVEIDTGLMLPNGQTITSAVTTFNGASGAVSFAVPVASASVTGVASFNATRFTVSATGAVDLASAFQVTGDTVVAGNAITATRSGNSVTIDNNGVRSFNGLTGAVNFAVPVASATVTGAASFGNQFVVSAAGAVSLTSNYVASVNGATGAITIQGLTGITASVSGQTIRLSHVVTNDNTSNTRYLAFYGVTSGVDAPKVDENLRYYPLSNTISAYGGLVLNGLSSGGVVGINTIVLADPNNGGISLYSSNNIVDISSAGGGGDVSSIRLVSYDGLDNGWNATISPATFYSTNRTFTLPDDSGIVALTKNVATSVNGATGAVGITGAGAILFTHSGKTGTFNARLASASATGVASFGNEFVVSGLGAVSLTSNYVKSFNGATGAVTFAVPLASSSATGAASFGNEFVVSGLGAVSLTSNYVKSFNGSTGAVTFAVPLASSSATGAASFGNEFVVSAAGAVSLTSNYVASVNGSTGAITNVARTNVANTFTALQSFSSGISASGATFGNVISIGNSATVCTIKLPGIATVFEGNNTISIQNPSSTPLYVTDATSFNAIEIKPAQYEILFYDNNDADTITLKADVQVGSGIHPTVTIPNYTTTIAGLAGTQTFTGTNTFNTLTNFGAGISSAGGTFSALTRFTAGISASGGVTFGGTVASDTGYRITSNAINAQTGATYTFLSTDNGKIVTFNRGSAVTVTIPSGLPVGFNCTGIQLGTGQVGFTAASGVTMNSYASAFKISGQHGAAALISYTTNIFNVSGTLSI